MRIRIEIEDGGFKSSHEFESQSIDKEALRDKIIGFLSASGIFDSKDERGAIAPAHDYHGPPRALHQIRILQYLVYISGAEGAV